MYIFTARKRSLGQGNIYRPQTSLGQGNIFRSVCQEFCPQGGWGVPTPGGGGACSQGGLLTEGSAPRGGSCKGVCSGGSAPGGACSQRVWGGAWWRPPGVGYCCRQYASYWNAFLFQKCVSRILSTGWVAYSWGVPAPGGCLFWWGACSQGGLLLGGACSGGCLLSGGACSQEGACSRVVPAPRGSAPGGCLVETPRIGYCCGQYASCWNAFLLKVLSLSFCVNKTKKNAFQ